MKKLLILGFALSLAACSSQPVNTAVNSADNKIVSNNDSSSGSAKLVSDKAISMSFKIKDAASLSRIKSFDAYLVKSATDPLGANSNVYGNGVKFSSNVVNGNVNLTFNNYPAGGPYYLAVQVFNDVVGATNRQNITAFNSAITGTDKQVAVSSNSASYTNNVLSYSDASTSLNIAINLVPFNELPVNITPENGNSTPTNGIIVE